MQEGSTSIKDTPLHLFPSLSLFVWVSQSANTQWRGKTTKGTTTFCSRHFIAIFDFDYPYTYIRTSTVLWQITGQSMITQGFSICAGFIAHVTAFIDRMTFNVYWGLYSLWSITLANVFTCQCLPYKLAMCVDVNIKAHNYCFSQQSFKPRPRMIFSTRNVVSLLSSCTSHIAEGEREAK